MNHVLVLESVLGSVFRARIGSTTGMVFWATKKPKIVASMSHFFVLDWLLGPVFRAGIMSDNGSFSLSD